MQVGASIGLEIVIEIILKFLIFKLDDFQAVQSGGDVGGVGER